MRMPRARDGVRVTAALVDFIRSGQIEGRAIVTGKDIAEYLAKMAVELRSRWRVPDHPL